jgi:Asp-tRNA(Asn)/Glu-tRNA(Gln) amidotransferase A subunit family amidase
MSIDLNKADAIAMPSACSGDRQNNLPLGVQIIAAPYNESLILRVAAYLEAQGIISAPVTHPL